MIGLPGFRRMSVPRSSSLARTARQPMVAPGPASPPGPPDYRWPSIFSASCCLGSAPMIRSTSAPSLKIRRLGMLRMPNRVARFPVLVHVDLDDFQASVVIARELHQRGRDGLAGPAPFRPEIDQYRRAAVNDLGFELIVRNRCRLSHYRCSFHGDGCNSLPAKFGVSRAICQAFSQSESPERIRRIRPGRSP